MFLIAGDLFHGGESNPVTPSVTGIVSQELAALRQKGVEILYTPGECDHPLLEAGGPVSNDCFTHIFTSGDGSGFSITRGNETVTVYGIASGPRGTGTVRRKENGGFHMALLHGDFCADEVGPGTEVPSLGRDEIRSLNLDFYALGHNHNFRIFKSRNRVIGDYPGSPEAVGPNETGERYVLSIAIENGEIIQIKRLAVNTITVDRIVIRARASIPPENCRHRREERIHARALTVILSGGRVSWTPYRNATAADSNGLNRRRILAGPRDPRPEYTGENSLRGAFFERLQR